MRKAILLLFPLLLLSCKKESSQLTANADIPAGRKITPDKERTVDTIFFSYEQDEKYNDYAVATSLKKVYGKDSLCVADFRLDFITHDKLVYSHNLQISGFDDGSEWSGSFEPDSVASVLKRISVGYPSCGYMQNHFLFYVTDKTGDLVHQWESSSDSGWGSWGEIVSGTPEDFYFRMQSFSPTDEEPVSDEEMGINEFSDSTHFELQNSGWTKTLLTEKGKPYRSRKLSFNEYHKTGN